MVATERLPSANDYTSWETQARPANAAGPPQPLRRAAAAAASASSAAADERQSRMGRLQEGAAAAPPSAHELNALAVLQQDRARPDVGPWDASVCVVAAEKGHRAVLEWAHASGCPWSAEINAAAARGGHLQLLRWLRASGCPWEDAPTYAGTCPSAAENGHLAALQFARRGDGCPWDEATCHKAAQGGHLDCLQWAHEHGCPWNADTASFAAYGGHLECLRWATARGIPYNELISSVAAQAGQAAILRWLFSQDSGRDVKWHPRTTYVAAGAGHLEVLKYAHANGCPDHEHACAAAAQAGHLGVLQWLLKASAAGESYRSRGAELCAAAARGGKLGVLQWLRGAGYEWDMLTAFEASAGGHKELAAWAQETGCPEYEADDY